MWRGWVCWCVPVSRGGMHGGRTWGMRQSGTPMPMSSCTLRSWEKKGGGQVCVGELGARSMSVELTSGRGGRRGTGGAATRWAAMRVKGWSTL
jgi:hypothetical protein